MSSIWSMELVTGTDESRRAAQQQLRRETRMRIANQNGWPELRRTDLAFGRHYVEHTPTGDLYRPKAGEVESGYKDAADAWYATATGDVVFLERPTGPKTRDELAEHRAERERRRNAPKPRRPWVKQKQRR